MNTIINSNLDQKVSKYSRMAKAVKALALPALMAVAAAMPSQASADYFVGPARLNSNRTGVLTLRTTGTPASAVTQIDFEFADNANFTNSRTISVKRPTQGWQSYGYAYASIVVNGSTNYQYWQGKLHYYQGTQKTTYWVTTHQIAPAGRAGNILQLSLNTYSVKGGNNGTDPTITVLLDGSAMVGGQWVEIAIDGPNAWPLANFHGFYIPEGSTSGSASWCVGTKNVIFNQSARIHSYVNGNHNYVDLQVRR